MNFQLASIPPQSGEFSYKISGALQLDLLLLVKLFQTIDIEIHDKAEEGIILRIEYDKFLYKIVLNLAAIYFYRTPFLTGLDTIVYIFFFQNPTKFLKEFHFQDSRHL